MKIIKQNNQYYIDKAVYDFVTKIPESDIREGDSIFFTKNAKFPRNLLFVSNKKFTRTIKFAKADVVVTSTFPNWWTGRAVYYNETTGTIGDVTGEEVWCLHTLPTKDVETVLQLVAIKQENPNARFVADTNAIKYINSGELITPDNVDDFADIYRGDKELFFQMMKNINVADCLPSAVYLLCIVLGLDRRQIANYLPTIAPQVFSVIRANYYDTTDVYKYLLKTEYKDFVIQNIIKDQANSMDRILKQFNLKTSKIEVDEISA